MSKQDVQIEQSKWNYQIGLEIAGYAKLICATAFGTWLSYSELYCKIFVDLKNKLF